MSHAKHEGATGEAARIAMFFRVLSERAERDPQLAASLASCLEESGLTTLSGVGEAEMKAHTTRQARRRVGVSEATGGQAVLDPFALWRAQGEAAVRDTLEGQDLRELRAVVRAHRLDPARVSSRWTARERVIALIMEQVKARLNHGRAFERV